MDHDLDGQRKQVQVQIHLLWLLVELGEYKQELQIGQEIKEHQHQDIIILMQQTLQDHSLQTLSHHGLGASMLFLLQEMRTVE